MKNFLVFLKILHQSLILFICINLASLTTYSHHCPCLFFQVWISRTHKERGQKLRDNPLTDSGAWVSISARTTASLTPRVLCRNRHACVCVCVCVHMCVTAATLRQQREFRHYITQILSLVVPSDSKHTQSCVFRSKWDYMPTDVSSDTML